MSFTNRIESPHGKGKIIADIKTNFDREARVELEYVGDINKITKKQYKAEIVSRANASLPVGEKVEYIKIIGITHD